MQVVGPNPRGGNLPLFSSETETQLILACQADKGKVPHGLKYKLAELVFKIIESCEKPRGEISDKEQEVEKDVDLGLRVINATKESLEDRKVSNRDIGKLYLDTAHLVLLSLSDLNLPQDIRNEP